MSSPFLVFEIVPPMIDTALNPAGRAKRGGYKAGLGPEEFVAAAMQGLADDKPEIGYAMTAAYATASRAELDRRFAEMNAGPFLQRGRAGTPD
jgi:short-subunit dehydrogenase involved in D-alanine esterification of teichoic acids